MIQNDDIALAYERIICICNQCNRREIVGADADVFRGLQSKFALAIESGNWEEYAQKEKQVLAHLRKALDKNPELKSKNFLDEESKQDFLGIDTISFIVGRIFETIKN